MTSDSLSGMIRQRDQLDAQIKQAQAEALTAYTDALDTIGAALGAWARAEGHTLGESDRKHARTLSVNSRVHVTLGYPCEQCRAFLSVAWGSEVPVLDGPRAEFAGGTPPPAPAVLALVKALVEGVPGDERPNDPAAP